MIANNIDVITVVIMSFLAIFGFAGAPGSLPSIICPLSFCELISLGKIVKRINHHKITKITTDPVSDNIV